MTSPSSPKIARTAAALVVGGELLSGKIRDENSYSLARALRSLGVDLVYVGIVPDDKKRIEEELLRQLAVVDIVFTSGGVGPTHDDVTVEAVASALGVEVDESPGFVAVLEEVYGERMTAAHRLMARVPRGAELLSTSDVRWPLVAADRVWMLPGVPELFRSKLAIVREHLRGPAPFHSEFVLLDAEEADIKDDLDVIVAAHPQVEVGSYPKWFDPTYKTRITFDGRQLELVHAAASELRRRLAHRVVGSID